MKIFIGNLCNEITQHDIIELFGNYGTVLSACIPKDNDGVHKGFAYVSMADRQHGALAVRSLDKTRFGRQFISVTESIHSEGYHERVA